MILLAATSKSDLAAYALMFRQLAQTARAIHDMHKATDDLRRVRGLATAVRAASKVLCVAFFGVGNVIVGDDGLFLVGSLDFVSSSASG